ncbi:MAG TPA: HAD hydrolase family protein [Gemmatimonadota bacterium]|jgi:3-deoxy-D-manno-octulosonate 8-phosphate phosphatase (KDO 8-P phosphatase)|nr:HAD hydrolase family protein [Gemmatimonadota bacterium]
MAEADPFRIRALVFDVDGVLTDGSVYIGGSGEEMKRFSVLDGPAFHWCRLMGYEVALLSGRSSRATARRAEELGVESVYQGVRDKARQVAVWAAERGLRPDEILYMGDDQIDLPVFEVAGIAVAPANAAPEVRERATHVTRRRGGEGAAREAVEWLLFRAGRLDEARRRYRNGLTGEGDGGDDPTEG